MHIYVYIDLFDLKTHAVFNTKKLIITQIVAHM